MKNGLIQFAIMEESTVEICVVIFAVVDEGGGGVVQLLTRNQLLLDVCRRTLSSYHYRLDLLC